VRLNPNIPWKTRGNGAISINIGKGDGEKIKIGEIDNKEIFSFFKEKSQDYNNSDIKKVENHIIFDIKKLIEQTIDEYAKLEDENTNSGFVLIDKQPSFETYEKAVKEIVSLKETEKILDLSKADYKGYKNKRGLIGATASVAWSPKDNRTYELIVYRDKEKWGTTRAVNNDSTMKMDEICISTFDNYDYKNNHNRLVPSSPCPVLYGIRGNDENELIHAKSLIESEKVDSWLIFETNQGTDDHLQKKSTDEIQPYQSVITKGAVCKTPYTIEGGHVIFKIKDKKGEIDCAAYEPTKEFRRIIRQLIEGDVVEVYGGIREKPLTINIEKIKISFLEKQNVKVENPVCPECGKHMKSKGKDQGFKCKNCGIKSDKPKIKEKHREIKLGLYEVPVCARRHLSKPLSRAKQP